MKNTRIISSVITGLLVFSLMVHAEETRGAPDVEYPNYHTVPKTSFTCAGQKHIPGFYADMETDCQVFHFCEENRQESFLCPTGTTFNQASLECEPRDSSNCSLSPQFYSVNSGPKMEDSRRDIFMALHLKSKSRSRLYINPSDVYRKITSLYDNSEIDEQPTKFKGVSAYVNADLNNKISHEQETYKETEVNTETDDRKESLSQFIEGLDENIQNDGVASEYGMVPSDINESYDMESEIFYDPVTEKYYVDSKEMVDQYNDFKYGGFENRYGVAYDGYADVIQSDPESEVSQEGIEGIEEFNEVSDIDGTSESENAQLDTQQPPRRIRRKPTYVVVQDDYEVVYAGDGRSLPIENSAEQYATQSTHTGDSSELLAEASSEGNDVQEQADSETSFETYEYQNQGDGPINIPETSQTSEEYEQELLAQLSLLGIREYDPEQPFPFEEQQRDGESLGDVPEDYQSDDKHAYVVNAIPPDYESYSVLYNGDARFAPEPESYQQTQDSEEISNWYQGDESFSVESGEYDDSDVIPDGSDTGVSGQGSKNEGVKIYDKTGFDSYWRNYFSPGCVCPQARSPDEPVLIPVAQYTPSGYRWNREFFTRFLRPPAVSETLNDQEFQYVSDDGISSEEYYPLHDSSYSDYFPSNVVGRAYDYAAEYGYPYANVYGNLYGGSYGYDASEETEAIGSPVLDGNAVDTTHAAAGDHYESEMQPWMQSHLTEGSAMDDGMLVTESSIPTGETIADLYATMSSDDIDVNELPSEFTSPGQAEEFYLFDFDEDSEEKTEQDTTGVSETDAEQLGIKELFQTEESLLHNEYLNDSKGGQGDSVFKSSENTQTSDEEFSREKVKSVDGAENANGKLDSMFHTAENVRLNVDLLSALNPVKASRSNIGNTHLFDDSTSLNNKIYPESSVQPKGDVEGFSSMASKVDNDFLPRAGDAGNPTSSKLSEIQERIRSLKKGKFGAFKKYVSSGEINN